MILNILDQYFFSTIQCKSADEKKVKKNEKKLLKNLQIYRIRYSFVLTKEQKYIIVKS
jgi:hypothetical protein